MKQPFSVIIFHIILHLHVQSSSASDQRQIFDKEEVRCSCLTSNNMIYFINKFNHVYWLKAYHMIVNGSTILWEIAVIRKQYFMRTE